MKTNLQWLEIGNYYVFHQTNSSVTTSVSGIAEN